MPAVGDDVTATSELYDKDVVLSRSRSLSLALALSLARSLSLMYARSLSHLSQEDMPVLSHRMHLLISFRKSTALPNRPLHILISDSKQ